MSDHILLTSNIKNTKMRHTPINGAGLKIQKLLFVEAPRLLLLDPWQFEHQSFLKPAAREIVSFFNLENFVHAHNTFHGVF